MISRQQRPAGERAARARSRAPWLVVAGVVVAIGLGVVLTGRPGGPRVGEHWHAPFKVIICGQRTPPLPASPGDIHTHGDDIIHIHPTRADTAGRNATLAAFLGTTALRVRPTSLSIGDTSYTNGDRCPSGREGRVSVVIGGQSRQDFASYIPRDGEQIEFRFGP